MIRFPLFRRRFMTFRVGQLNKIRPLQELQELPVGAILHVLDNFAMVGEKMKYYPHLDNPFINMNSYKLYVYNMTGPGKEPRPTDVVPYSLAKMILTNSGVMGQLQEFKRSLSPRVMWAEDITLLPNRAVTQPIVNYNAIFRARVMGVRRKVRFMNFLWAQILNTIVRAPDRQHFIHVPLETLQFERKDFVRVFKKYDRIATKYPEISTYLFLAHFYSILNKRMVLPKRGLAFEDAEDAVEALSPSIEDYDPEANSKEWFTALKSYMLDPEYLEASLESLKGDENPYEVSIFEHLPAKLFENINFIFTCGPNYICYNLRDLKELNASGAALMRIIKQINTLTSSAGQTGTAEDYVEEEPPMVAEEITDVDETGEKPNQPTFAIPMTKEETEAAYDMDLKELDDIDKILDHTMNEVKASSSQPKKPLTPAQKEHIKVIGKQYKKLTMNGKTFEQLMTEVPTFDEKPPELDNIEAVKDGSISKEATQSSTIELDRNYLKQMFDRDLANILTSFNKQGMFLVGFQEEVQTDELNDKKTFVAAYEDLNHKQHKLRFSIPNLDQNGRFRSNGTVKSMIKQRVSNPICKVSPSRVTLNSNYNKLLVERNDAVAHSFKDWFSSVIGKCRTSGFRMQTVHSAYKFPNKPFPFELTEIGSKYERINIDGGTMFFHVPERGNHVPEKYREKVKEAESNFGYWFGYRGDEHFFMTVKGAVTVRNLKTDEELLYGAFEDFMEWISGIELKKVVEYIDLTVLSKKVPIILPLGFRYGLTEMLKYTGTDYETFDAGTRYEKRNSDLIVKFKDKHLVIRRTPRMNALLFGGLTTYDFSGVTLEEMDEKDVYYDMLQQKKLSINVLKGIDAMFDLFIDPITRDVLRELRQPTELRDLMLRAITMLTTSEHMPAASSVNFRFRGAEQVTGIVYNELAKTFANYRNRAVGSGNKFSVKEFQIKQRIEQDQLSENVSIINPLDDIKQFSKFSNAGSGGRSNETFRVPDRQFTEDSVGVVSEATVDNGKVGLNATLPANPVFANARGMIGEINKADLKPENMLSMTSLVMAGATNDDSKRKFVRLSRVTVIE